MDIRDILVSNSPSQGEVPAPTEELSEELRGRKKRKHSVTGVTWDPATKRQMPSRSVTKTALLNAHVITTPSSDPDIPDEPLAATAIKQLERQQLWPTDKRLPRLGLTLAIAPVPPVRPVQLTGNGKFTLRRSNNLLAALIQATGVLADKPCDGCLRGTGLFVGCVIPRDPEHQTSIFGVCANHYYNSNGLLCTLANPKSAEESYMIDPIPKAIGELIVTLINDRLGQVQFRRSPKHGFRYISDCFDKLHLALKEERNCRNPDSRRWGKSIAIPDDVDDSAEMEMGEATDNGASSTPFFQPIGRDKPQPTKMSRSKIYDCVPVMEELLQQLGNELQQSEKRLQQLREELQLSGEASGMSRSAVENDS